MSQKEKKDKVVMRHILEIRLKKRLFSFMDYSGKLTDHLIKELDGENIRLTRNGSRIDVASGDFSEVFFVGYENFGFQIEAAESFQMFRRGVESLFDSLESFEKYNPESYVRVGAKSTIFSHFKGDSFETLKQRYTEKVFADYKKVETKTSAVLSDVASTFELKRGDGVATVLTGPMTKTEVIQKSFIRQDLYDGFDRGNGLFIDIDFSKNREVSISGLDILKTESLDCIDNVEAIFDGFNVFLSNTEHGR